MTPLLTTTTLLLSASIPQIRAQAPDDEVAVPADFPKAFITAMAVAAVGVAVVMTLICVFAHCWQYILGPRSSRPDGSSSAVPERWLEPVFEWPRQLGPWSRNNRNRRRKRIGRDEQTQQRRRGRRGAGLRMSMLPRRWRGERRRSQGREGMCRGWV
ncbi:hypothetical protein GGR54DRAFT_8126 [Hypoxylon sp. NC1633]|nr:hypothetical protein GGR54DRAFT_8126 [Hypoxylon sp. NC1633]